MELPLLDGHIDADDILPYNAACSNIQMSVHSIALVFLLMKVEAHSPNLRIAHEPFTQTHSRSMSSEGSVTVIFGDSIHVGCITSLDCIALRSFLWCNTPAIVDATQTEMNDWNKLREQRSLHQADFVLNFGHCDKCWSGNPH